MSNGSIVKIDPQNIYADLRGNVRIYGGVVVHHTAIFADRAKPKTWSGQALVVEKQHLKERNWKHGMGYHFLIEADGTIHTGRRWLEQLLGAHTLGGFNKWIGICFAGHFNKQLPTRKQLKSFRELIDWFSGMKIVPHKAVWATMCCGNKIDFKYWFKNIDIVKP